MRIKTLEDTNTGARLVSAAALVALGAFWLLAGPGVQSAAAQSNGNSGADQYLEQVPNPSGDNPGHKSSGGKSGGSKSGSGGSSGSSGSGNGQGSSGSGSGKYGQGETEDRLRQTGDTPSTPTKKKHNKATKNGDQTSTQPQSTQGDRASAVAPVDTKPPDDGANGGLSTGVVVLVVLLLLGPLAFFAFRRFQGRRTTTVS